MENLKVSVYEFRDLIRSYGIVELTDKEYKALIEILGRNSKNIVNEFRKIFGDIKCFKIGRGLMIYEEKPYDMVYIMIELTNGDQYVFEVYPNSMTIASNTKAQQLFRTIYIFAETFIGDVLEKPKSMLIGLL